MAGCAHAVPVHSPAAPVAPVARFPDVGSECVKPFMAARVPGSGGGLKAASRERDQVLAKGVVSENPFGLERACGYGGMVGQDAKEGLSGWPKTGLEAGQFSDVERGSGAGEWLAIAFRVQWTFRQRVVGRLPGLGGVPVAWSAGCGACILRFERGGRCSGRNRRNRVGFANQCEDADQGDDDAQCQTFAVARNPRDVGGSG